MLREAEIHGARREWEVMREEKKEILPNRAPRNSCARAKLTWDNVLGAGHMLEKLSCVPKNKTSSSLSVCTGAFLLGISLTSGCQVPSISFCVFNLEEMGNIPHFLILRKVGGLKGMGQGTGGQGLMAKPTCGFVM